jgi:hypothetical protein
MEFFSLLNSFLHSEIYSEQKKIVILINLYEQQKLVILVKFIWPDSNKKNHFLEQLTNTYIYHFSG